ncbi:glutamine--fructose-6-phosphate transaminase (isomerizing) [Candidatus Parcubacteria bacterium]|nr:glutamine--fructose-6-phosphate transaminase (isomerizing) [Candidatus Parcubacteria bacterium]
MCGIVGYIGKKNDPQIGLNALKRLEYRGYDSAGMAVFNPEKQEIFCLKAKGKISELENKFSQSPFNGNPFILHTRWATHGEASEINAHPHWDCKKNIYVVHNGIIENYKELKEQLMSEGHQFISETDTEVIAHLIESCFKSNLEEAVRQALKKVKGAYALAVIARKDPEKIVAAKLGSPLILGINNDEFLVASDTSAIISHTNQVITLDDNEIAVLSPNNFFILKEKPIEKIEWETEEAQKQGFSHFMLKEIFEQPSTIEKSIAGRMILEQGLAKLGGLEQVSEQLKKIEKVVIVACGTASYAGKVGEYMFEEYAKIPTKLEIGSEFRYKNSILDDKTAVLVISQSGETADTLEAVKEAKRKGCLCLGLVNRVGSSIARETDAGVYCRIGPEIAVASTKAFISQLSILVLITVGLGRQREMSLVVGKKILEELQKLPELSKKIFSQADYIKELARKYSQYRNFYFLGRKYNFPIALEGSHKLKEIAWKIHAEAYPAGDMKHGAIALIDENFPTCVICPSDSVYDKMKNAIEEIKARHGKILAVATEGNEEIKNLADDVIYIPKTLEMLTPILSIIPLQLFAAYLGLELGLDIDKPRNLAKSVTVE